MGAVVRKKAQFSENLAWSPAWSEESLNATTLCSHCPHLLNGLTPANWLPLSAWQGVMGVPYVAGKGRHLEREVV